jgi:hypothetical protein
MEHLSEECQAAGYSTVDCDGIGGTAIFPGFGEINLKTLTPERCGELVDGGFKWIVKADSSDDKDAKKAAKSDKKDTKKADLSEYVAAKETFYPGGEDEEK